jgi:hypothetical protein
MRLLAWFLVILVAIGCGGCADGPSTANGSLEVTGTYEGGFESSFFVPCGTAETWWVEADPAFQQQYAALVTRDYEPVFIRMRGDRSALGTYGHQGLAVREFVVKEVLEMRLAISTDCISQE